MEVTHWICLTFILIESITIVRYIDKSVLTQERKHAHEGEGFIETLTKTIHSIGWNYLVYTSQIVTDFFGAHCL